jgi:hypothetical protein
MSQEQNTPNINPEIETVGNTFLDNILIFFKSLALTIYDILKDVLLFAFDLFISFGVLVLNGLAGVLQLVDLTSYVSGMPPEVLWIMSATGIGEAVGIVMTAGAARLLMQLIPFVRLGS